MEIKVKVLKTVVMARTIKQLKSKIESNKIWFCGGFGDGLKSMSDRKNEFVYVYNIEKKNAKRVRIKGSDKYKQVSEAICTAYVYKFPTELLYMAKLKVKQKTRNFELVKY
jgi:hypothetical protein